MSQPLETIIEDISSTHGYAVVDIKSLMEGKSHQLFKIRLQDGSELCLRIPKDTFAAALSKRGIKILKRLKCMEPSLRVPAVINEANDSYTLFQYLEGDPIASWKNQILPPDTHLLFLKDLATFFFTLWTLDFQNDPDPTLTYEAWLETEIDLAIRRSIENGGWGEPVQFLHRRTIFRCHVPEDDNDTKGVRHGDLNGWNVLASASGLSGVIDWDTAAMVPLPAVVQHPLFIADIPGWKHDHDPDITFQNDRQILEQEVTKLATASKLPSSRRVAELLSSSFERQFLEQSLRNKVINQKYIELRLRSNPIDSLLAKKELDDFLVKNKDLKDHEHVKELCRLFPNSET